MAQLIFGLLSLILFSNGILEAQNDELLLGNVPLLMHQYQVPGVALGIVKNGKISCIKCFGFADRKSLSEVEADSFFQAASISKTITAWGVVLLAKRGMLDLDESVIKYLCKWKIPDAEYPKEDITIRRVLNHTAGLSEVSYGYRDCQAPTPDLAYSLNGFSGTHAPLRLVDRPGESFLYTGGGYTLLQSMIEDVTKMSFQDYMMQVLPVLKLSNSSFEFPANQANKICKPYDVLGRSPSLRRFTEQAAAGLYTTIKDLAAFTEYSLSSPLLRDMIGIEEGYALGYEVEWLEPNVPLAFHLGANPGWRAGLFILPSLKGGLVILTNSDHGADLVQDIASAWAKEMTGITPKFYQETLYARYFMKLVNILIFSLLGYCLFKFIVQCVRKERCVRLIRGRIIFRTVACMGVIILWRRLFFHEIAIGGGMWIIRAFMPSGFSLLSISIYILATFGILASFTVRVESNNRVTNSDKNT